MTVALLGKTVSPSHLNDRSYHRVEEAEQELKEVWSKNKLICSADQAWIPILGIYSHQTAEQCILADKKRGLFRRLSPRTPRIAPPNPPLICSWSLCKYPLKTLPEQNRRLRRSWTKEPASSFSLTALLCQNRPWEWRQSPDHQPVPAAKSCIPAGYF